MGSNLLQDIDEFMSFGTVLHEQGIMTARDFLGLVEPNLDGVTSLLDIDAGKMHRLILIARSKLSEEELREFEATDIKKIGEDYKLGMQFRRNNDDE